ncbi:MAG TPA: hypothetical protein VK217_04180 [Acidimicrobiales bacterium]|nr:hypothetical protein [Acidimicrobiales bacterium]
MTELKDSATGDLQYASDLRVRTRLARNGDWFALLVFGLVVLGSMPFYISPILSASSPGCTATGPGVTCISSASTTVPLGGGLGSPFVWSSLNRWVTVYWTISMVLALAAVVLYYWRRSRSVGVKGRLWPFVVVGLGLLLLAIFSGGWVAIPQIPDFWMRGTQALLIIAMAIIALALLERDRSLGLFAVGFFGLALLSCLYDDVNILQRIGLGAPFADSGNQLPNLLLPGLYLLLGGVGFRVGRRWARHGS